MPRPGRATCGSFFNVVEQTVALSVTPLVPLRSSSARCSSFLVNVLAFDVEVAGNAASSSDYLVQLLKMTRGNVSQAARLAKRNRSDFDFALASISAQSSRAWCPSNRTGGQLAARTLRRGRQQPINQLRWCCREGVLALAQRFASGRRP
ncbi:MAG: hypothetical protein U1E63_00375 [Burkholderiales bacterium]